MRVQRVQRVQKVCVNIEPTMITAANFYFILLTTLILINLAALLIALAIFFWVRRLVSLAKRALAIEGEIKQSVADELTSQGRENLDKLIAIYQKKLDEQTNEHFRHLSEILTENVKSLSEFVKKQEGLTVKSSEFALERLIAKTSEQIEQYKEYQMRRVDEQATVIFEKVIKEVLGRAITLEEQEELVRDSMKRAKAEGIFSTLSPKLTVTLPKRQTNEFASRQTNDESKKIALAKK